MKPSIFLSAVLLAVGAVSLSGCGSKASEPVEEPEAETVQEQSLDKEEPPEEEPDADDPALQYGSALASLNPERLPEALELTVPGSNAYGFAVYYLSLAQADIDAGFEHTGFVVEANDDGFKVCDYDAECTDYSDFEYEDGKLADFSIEGLPLQGRIMLGDGSVEPLGEYGDVSLVAAFLRSTGQMMTLWDYKPKTDDVWMAGLWENPDGEQVEAALRSSPDEIHAGEDIIYGLFFDDVEFGGVLALYYGVGGEWEDTPLMFDMVANE